MIYCLLTLILLGVILIIVGLFFVLDAVAKVNDFSKEDAYLQDATQKAKNELRKIPPQKN